MLRRTVVSLIALTAAVMITAGTSHAAPAQSDDYTAACDIAVSPPNPHAGDTVTVTGANFPTSPATVSIGIDDPSHEIGTGHVDSSGHFSAQVTIPANTSPGTHVIGATCASTGGFALTNVNVLAAAASQSSSSSSATAPLARTGTDTQPLVLAGLGAVAVGTALVLTARRRRANRVAV
jgi:LPXTG-motif cell wall-anchored protein